MDSQRKAAEAASTNNEHSTTEFKRDMGFWGNLALGFTYLSPVVGVYATFSASIALAGPPAFWMLVIAGLGQLLVATVFGEVVSQYPVAGGIYPWNRRLWGAKWGWISGWIYMIAINATIASVAYGAGPFLGALLGIEMNASANVLLALLIILLATFANLGGTKFLAKVAFVGFVLEIIASAVIGIWLLISVRKHDLSVLFQDFRPLEMQENTPFLLAFLGAAIMGIYLYYGFEANGDVAEEVQNPGRVIPKAMRMTIYVGGVASMFIALGLILAVGSFEDIINGTIPDPINAIFLEAFGPIGFRIVMAVVLVSFLSCTISLQAAASRLMFSMGRDNQLPGAKYLKRFNKKRAVPPYALIVAGVLPAIVVVISLLSEDALIAIISFASFGIYLAFSSVVLASLRARFLGWKPSGEFTMGKWGWPITIAAFVYQIFAMIIVAWPVADAPWYDAWLVAIMGVVVVGVGCIYLFTAKPETKGGTEAGIATGAIDTSRYPIAPTEEIVDMAVRLDGGNPHLYPDNQGPRD
ncbi:APC family permease [Gulosibacter molinativorax]|uniref:Amino acid permease n=1 Tax=Gulosibacter molinativorax TaxID=256821 RepID=A0ABT7C4F3_9MICO|nr:APC family permease [Gulosibacter molinativorax]MDJ1370089.1 amino acid permease [Gulosibacter molinativorax]QUY63718.1 Amino acid permease [Gulosibacter molinativorax]